METAHKVSKPGSTPVWEYKGIRVVNSAGSRWGKGFIYNINGVTRYSTTLEGAKFHIDQEGVTA